MITDTWTVLFATSFSGLGTPGNDLVESRIVSERLCAKPDVKSLAELQVPSIRVKYDAFN